MSGPTPDRQYGQYLVRADSRRDAKDIAASDPFYGGGVHHVRDHRVGSPPDDAHWSVHLGGAGAAATRLITDSRVIDCLSANPHPQHSPRGRGCVPSSPPLKVPAEFTSPSEEVGAQCRVRAARHAGANYATDDLNVTSSAGSFWRGSALRAAARPAFLDTPAATPYQAAQRRCRARALPRRAPATAATALPMGRPRLARA